ncbi:alpha/beta hydrolase [Mesoterricola silvestris]|uniref:alpha/beta hydrolase n=1 Tax=Mesoterricola silvestris TaxID=2927979 RepID=UPI00292FFE7E|nr:hypothetical protein [Mesoterricola silvestris]
MLKSPARFILGPAFLALAVLGVFVVSRARSVARELTDPPFYHPQPRERVDATYRDLARGGAGDPGGAWETFQAGPREVWFLRRAQPSRGVVLMLHGFGDDRWGTSPALRMFPDLDAAIFTYLGRDDAMRAGGPVPPVTLGARESREVAMVVHALEARGYPRGRILLLGRSLGASVGLLALAQLEKEGRGPLGGIIWEGAPASSRDFAERLVRGPEDRFWHRFLAPAIGSLGSAWAAARGGYARDETDLRRRIDGMRLGTPSLCFIASQDRLAPPAVQRWVASRFVENRTVEVPTWHLHCSEILGSRYGDEVRDAARAWLIRR